MASVSYLHTHYGLSLSLAFIPCANGTIIIKGLIAIPGG
jgi:hypothetical protein